MIDSLTTDTPGYTMDATETLSKGNFVALTQEERNDLRKKVLRGESLTLEEARSVFETIRQAQGVAAIDGEAKPKRGKRTPGVSDEQLDADLAGLGF